MSQDLQPGTSDPRSKKGKVVGLIKLIPLIGNPIAYVVEKWGIKETVFLIIGFLIGWGFVYWGKAPEVLIAIYRVTQAPPKVESKPSHIDFNVVEPTPEWLQTHVFWLEQEGNDLKGKGQIQGYQICVLESKIDVTSTAKSWILEKFAWELKTEYDREISGFAFTSNSGGLFNLLDPSKDNPATISFKVTTYRMESKLLALLRVSWKQGGSNAMCKDLHSAVR